MGRFKSLEHKFKGLVFEIFKVFLKKGRDGFTVLDGKSIQKVLFIRPEKIGDMVVSLPVFDELLRRYPHIYIGILCSPRSYEIIRHDPRFDRVFLYRKNIVRDLLELLAIRRDMYDCVVDMVDDDSLTGLVLSQLSVAESPRIGSGKKQYARHYDYVSSHRDRNITHSIDRALCLLDAFGVDGRNADRYAQPHVGDEEFRRADSFLISTAVPGASGMAVGFNLSAGKTTRQWAGEKSRELITSILDYFPESRVILITAPSDRPRGEELERLFDQRVVQVPPELSITEVSAIISRIDLLITPDTSLVHIARSFKVPVVGMYPRPQWNLERWRPYGQQSGVVLSNNDDHIFDITSARVFAEVRKVVEQQGVGQT